MVLTNSYSVLIVHQILFSSSSHERLITTHWNITCKMFMAWGWENLVIKYDQVFKIIDVLSVYRKVRWTRMWNLDKEEVDNTGFVVIPTFVTAALRKQLTIWSRLAYKLWSSCLGLPSASIRGTCIPLEYSNF